MLSSQLTPAPVWFSQYFVALNCCSKWLILLCITLPGLSTLIHLTLMIWHIYNRFCSTIPLITTAPLIVIATCSQQSILTTMELMLGVGPLLCHGTLPLALLAAASQDAWISVFHKAMDPLQMMLLTSWRSLDESHSCIPQLHIFLSSCLLLDILSTVYMYVHPSAICVKKERF